MIPEENIFQNCPIGNNSCSNALVSVAPHLFYNIVPAIGLSLEPDLILYLWREDTLYVHINIFVLIKLFAMEMCDSSSSKDSILPFKSLLHKSFLTAV